MKNYKPIFAVLSVSLVSLVLALSMNGCSDDVVTNTTPPPNQPGTSPSNTSMSVAVSIPQGAQGLGPNAFGTNPLNVMAGAEVTWTNNDSIPHTVTSDTGEFDSNTLEPGQTFSHTFDNAGTFPYHCQIHPTMSGTIQVNGAQPS